MSEERDRFISMVAGYFLLMALFSCLISGWLGAHH